MVTIQEYLDVFQRSQCEHGFLGRMLTAAHIPVIHLCHL